MVSQGPFDETTACNVGDVCVITLFGIWVAVSELERNNDSIYIYI